MMGAEYFVAGATAAARPAGGSGRLRSVHRWVAGFFLLTVAANFAVRAWGAPPAWITYAPLPPLFLLMGTGVVMLVAPAAAARSARRMRGQSGPDGGRP